MRAGPAVLALPWGSLALIEPVGTTSISATGSVERSVEPLARCLTLVIFASIPYGVSGPTPSARTSPRAAWISFAEPDHARCAGRGGRLHGLGPGSQNRCGRLQRGIAEEKPILTRRERTVLPARRALILSDTLPVFVPLRFQVRDPEPAVLALDLRPARRTHRRPLASSSEINVRLPSAHTRPVRTSGAPTAARAGAASVTRAFERAPASAGAPNRAAAHTAPKTRGQRPRARHQI